MEVEYDDIRLTVLDLTRFERTSIYTPDESDLLKIRYVLGFTMTYAPGGRPKLVSTTETSKSTRELLSGTDQSAAVLSSLARGRDDVQYSQPVLETDTPADIDRTQYRSGPETDAELSRRLLLPRRKFILWAFSRQTGTPIRWLESPRPGFPTDASNGPMPLSCDVVSATGEPNAVAVHWQVQTDLTPSGSGDEKMVLSHRWDMKHGHDENQYLTRTIEGTIVFNGGVIRRLGIRPDALRNQFLHPIPLGFQRGPVDVSQSSDGLTIRYKIIDTDPTIVFDPGSSGATTVNIMEKVSYNRPTTWNKDNNGRFEKQ